MRYLDRRSRLLRLIVVPCLCLWLAGSTRALAVAPDDLSQLSLEDLLEVEVVSASAGRDTLIDAPAPMVVVTAKDIRDRGYSNVAEIVQDLPGFDISVTNGTSYMMAYQRGYRTPFTQRTLLLIDGRVDNHLWTHHAELSRQYPVTNIERVEVLYGPASAVYGPNAFLGIINIITRDAADLEDGEVDARVELEVGSWRSRGVDLTAGARWGDLSLSLAGKLFRSDEADLSERWGWLGEERLGSVEHWGPLVTGELQNAGQPLGEYHDPTDDHGLKVDLAYGGLRVGVMQWRRREAYGPYYAADRAQSNAWWSFTSLQAWAELSANPLPDLQSETRVVFRRSRVYGDWAEANPIATAPETSTVSLTAWNSVSDAIRIEQQLQGRVGEHLELAGGLKFERKELTMAYDIPGYPGTVSSTAPAGSAVVDSTSTEAYVRPPPPGAMPSDNLILTEDIGGFVQAIVDLQRLRLVGGLRYDRNSIYGGSVNPRGALILKLADNQLALKLIVGTAFQEPAPIQLFGGWNGRAANPDLKPERALNTDLVLMLIRPRVHADLSLYFAHYEDVVVDTSENIGERNVFGGELKFRAELPLALPSSSGLRVWGHMSVAISRSERRFDFPTSTWVDGVSNLGDIAPLKLGFGLTLPILDVADLTVRGNFVSQRTPYLRNVLRDPAREGGVRHIDPYLTLDAHLRAHWKLFSLGLKVENLTGARYFHPGPETASAGDGFSDDLSVRATGFHNSLIPQPGRSFWAVLGFDL